MKYVALLRGINVGGNNKIEMKKLKVAFERIGLKDVVTYINSGNVIFSGEGANLAAKIEKAIEDDFGLKIPVVVRSEKDYAKLMKALPAKWQNDKEMKSDVMFLWDEVDSPKVLKDLDIKEGIDTVKYAAGCVLWMIDRKNQAKSGLILLVKNPLYKKVTVRNVNTVRKIAGLMGLA